MQSLTIGLLIAAVLCLLPALVLRRSRRHYAIGVAASVLVSVVTAFATLVAPEVRFDIFATYFSPALEETVRVGFLFGLLTNTRQQAAPRAIGLAFGLGWAAFELCLTWLDLVAVPPNSASSTKLVYLIAAPVSPFFMHVALSVGALWMGARGAKLLSILGMLTAVHLLNNASVFAFDYQFSSGIQLLFIALRITLFSVATWIFLRE